MKLSKLLLIVGMLLINCFSAMSVSSKLMDGYKNGSGSYIWFENKTDSTFVDTKGTNWYKVTDHFENWNEALLVRKANIYALISFGFDSILVSQDVEIFDEKSELFTKHSKLNNSKFYTASWQKSLNSDNLKYTARKTKQIKIGNERTKLVLKFYSQKYSIGNISALGLCKKKLVPHCVEAGMEIIEILCKIIVNNDDPHDDIIFDMHIRNSVKLIRIVESRN